MLAAVLAAVADAERRVVVGPPQPVPEGVVVVREQPPGGGPVAAMRAGLGRVDADVVAVLAGDLPFLTRTLGPGCASGSAGDGVLVVDDTGRDQLLLGVWRTAALRRRAGRRRRAASLRRVLAPLAVDRLAPGRRARACPPRGWTATPRPISPGPRGQPADLDG